MVFVSTVNREGRSPDVIDRGSAFLDDVSTLSIYSDANPFFRSDYTEFDCNDLANMMRESPAKIPFVNINNVQETTSPEYLALLVAILNKADSLSCNSLGGDAVYACFMGSMFQPNGLRELNIGSSALLLSTFQAMLLFEGIAVSQSLEKLDLFGKFSEPAEAGTALANALGRNSSLLSLKFFVNLEEGGGTELGDVVKAAITDKRIRYFSIGSASYRHRQQLPFDAMTEALCADKCTVKKLVINNSIEPTARAHSTVSSKHIESLQNTSVTHYTVNETSLDGFRIMETAGLFKLLKELNICSNKISDLSPLDPLLVGNDLTLETLHLICNRIGEKDAVEFFRKMPKMTCLRRVSITENPCSGYESLKDVIAEVTWQNRSIECINCASGCQDYFSELDVPLSLNRGGRRALEIDSSKPLPVNLWPHVLERAAKLSYFSCHDFVNGSPSLEYTRPDVVFWLLKEKMLGSSL